MAFPGHLSPAEIEALVGKAIDSDLLLIDRALLLQGILRTFVLGLRDDGDPLTRFSRDLVKINEVERLVDGQVPIVQFLRNCGAQLRFRGRSEAEDFDRAASRIGNDCQGVPPLPATATLPEVVRNEAIVGVDDMVDFPFLQAGSKVGRSVALLSVPRFENGVQKRTEAGVPWLMNGTGWVIGPRLLITNHHVIRARTAGEAPPSADDFNRQAEEAIADFDFDAPGSARAKATVDRLEASSRELDYAIVRLAQDPGREALRIHPQKVVVGAATYWPVNIIQHPNGRPKRVAFRNNLLTGADADTIRYFTDTDFGSSGSPVCDDDWRVVGLHRGAKMVNVTFQGKPTSCVNFGSQIQAILADVQAQKPALFAEITA